MKLYFFNENKIIILLVSLLDLYDHLVTTLLHGSTTFVLEDVLNLLMKYYHSKKNINAIYDEGLYMKGGRKHKRQKEKGSSRDKKSQSNA
ncbi:unnamed protein product [Spirodela intermedia]|uniref:Uncharacterized protein n=1 Tax=Spirodela intermedia TaxID=51605 RepID=A0A7I8ISP7_SPIIN|nr:unnamed protein product [Spirodela intermedia]CAA6660889.1 unnamed protein product [Spirodela intermedia]